jgi:hypothetical protein
VGHRRASRGISAGFALALCLGLARGASAAGGLPLYPGSLMLGEGWGCVSV